MKKYSSKQAKKGKTAYRTPKFFISEKINKTSSPIYRQWHLAQKLEPRKCKKEIKKKK